MWSPCPTRWSSVAVTTPLKKIPYYRLSQSTLSIKR
jgi:hypothetical protein